MLDVLALETQINGAMQAGRVPGLAIAVVRDREVVYAQGFGVTSVEDGGLAVTPQTLFRIGSLTKGLTATAVMRLVQDGQLELDRAVADYVPWLEFGEAGAKRHVSLRMLLSHTAGLPTSHTPYGRRDPGGLEAYVREDVPRYRFVAPPGTLYAYSNPGVRIAGYLLQVIGGWPYTELMQQLVFDPLAMERTTFDPLVAMTYPLAQSHDLDREGRLRVRHRFAEDTGGYPSGAALSTVLDLAHFAMMQMDGGWFRGRQVLGPELVAEMQSAQADMYTASRGSYGLGLAIDHYKGVTTVAHEGSISTFGSRLVMVPEERLATVLLFNRAPGFWERARAITEAVLDQVLGLAGDTPADETTARPVDRSLWPTYEGWYLGDWRGLARIEAVERGLLIEWNGQRVALEAIRDDLFFGNKPDGERVSVGFVADGRGRVEYLQVNSSPCRRFDGPVGLAPEAARLEAYAGAYCGVESLAFRVEGENLWVYVEDAGREMACVALGEGLFACDAGLLEFQVGEDGLVQALELGRVYHLVRGE
jgi:CubicO group peptidase (beta-lactamase class C family)